jgi:F-type H+-transporting ATPase subunit b
MFQRTRLLVGFLALVLLGEGVGVAAEGESNLFAGDIGNAVWTLLIFVVVILVLGKFAWGPLLSTLQERERFIRDSLEQAKADREAAESRLEEYSAKLDQARADATSIVDEGRRNAEVVRRRVEDEAREETERMVERAKREIEIAKQTAIKDLFAMSANLATHAASKIVGRELQPQDHERLVTESIEELERLESS